LELFKSKTGVRCIGGIFNTRHENDVALVPDKPGKTGTPTIEDVDEDSVKLSWTPPKTDGGDKVKGYVIEAKEKGSNKWKPLNAKSPCKDTHFTGRPIFSLYLSPLSVIAVIYLLIF